MKLQPSPARCPMHGVNICKGRTITSLLLWLRRLSSNSSARRDGQGRIEKLSSLSRIGEEQESGNRARTRIRFTFLLGVVSPCTAWQAQAQAENPAYPAMAQANKLAGRLVIFRYE